MKKLFLYILVLMAPITLFSQSSEREKLLDEIATKQINKQFFTYYQLTAFADAKENKPSNYDNLAFEMCMYNTTYDLSRKQLAKAYKELTDDEIKEYVNFMNSEAVKRMDSKELQIEFVTTYASAIITNALGSKLGVGTISASEFKIKDKEFTALCEEYYNKLIPNKETFLEALRKNVASRGSSGTKLPTKKDLENMGFIDLMTPILTQATYKYVSLEQLKEVVAFYKSPAGQKVMKYTQNMQTSIYNNSTDGTTATGIFQALGINEQEVTAEIEKRFNSYTIEDLKKYIEVRKKIKFEKVEPYKEIATVPYKKGTFTGETFYGVPDGYGTFTDKKGIKYTGTFANGKMHGRIVVRKEGADSLVQMYALGKKMKVQSVGRRADGSVTAPPTYISTTGEDVTMGYGYLQSEGVTKIGFIIDGELQGDGECLARGGDEIQKGFFKDGKFVRGTIETKYSNSKNIFTGTTQQFNLLYTVREGTNNIEFNNGGSIEYKGRLIDNKYDGEGDYNYISQKGNITKNKGYFAYGKLYGEGETWKCNSDKTVINAYKGDFIADEFHGKGVWTITNKESFKGGGCSLTINNNLSFETDEPEFTVIFEGEFNNDKFINGKITLSNGDWLEGKFKNGILVEGSCKINYAADNRSAIKVSALKNIKTGEFYEGEIKYGMKNGKGVLQTSYTLRNNKEYMRTEEGIFEDGVLVEGTVKNEKGKIIKTLKPKE